MKWNSKNDPYNKINQMH